MTNKQPSSRLLLNIAIAMAMACLAPTVMANDLQAGAGFDSLLFPYSPVAPSPALLSATSMHNNPANISYIDAAQWSLHANARRNQYSADSVLAAEGVVGTAVGTAVLGSDGNISSNKVNVGGYVALPKVNYLDYTDLNVAFGVYRRNSWNVDYPADFKGRNLADKAKVVTDTAEVNIAFPVNASQTLRVGGGLAINRTAAAFAANMPDNLGAYEVVGLDQQSKSYQYGFTYTPNAQWQIAASERSQLTLTVEGNMHGFVPEQLAAAGPPAEVGFDALNVSSKGRISFSIPASRRVGARYQLAPALWLGAAWQSTKWADAATIALSSDITTAQLEALIRAQGDSQSSTDIFVRTNTIRTNLRQKNIALNYKDTNAYSVSLQWLYRRATVAASVGWEESPYKSAAQSLYAPAGDKWVAALGSSYPLANNGAIKVAAQLAVVPDTSVVISDASNRYFADIARYDLNTLVEWVRRF